MSGPAILSSTMLARKGAATPTGYTPIRGHDVGSISSANENAGEVAPSAPLAFAGGGPTLPDSERARVSVRLDRDRHLKLRLSAAHLQTSLQEVITSALDRYLDEIGAEVLQNDCTCLSVTGPETPRDGSTD